MDKADVINVMKNIEKNSKGMGMTFLNNNTSTRIIVDPCQKMELQRTKIQENVQSQLEEKRTREIENNESLKRIVNCNQELVSYNEKILKKINSLDDTLLFLNKSFLDKSKDDLENNKIQNALLLELITIIDSKDESKLNKFISNLAVPVSVGLIVEYLKLKLKF